MHHRVRRPYPYWGWGALSAGLGATIMMKADSSRIFAVGWVCLVLGTVYLVVVNRSQARHAAATRQAPLEYDVAKAVGPAVRPKARRTARPSRSEAPSGVSSRA